MGRVLRPSVCNAMHTVCVSSGVYHRLFLLITLWNCGTANAVAQTVPDSISQDRWRWLYLLAIVLLVTLTLNILFRLKAAHREQARSNLRLKELTDSLGTGLMQFWYHPSQTVTVEFMNPTAMRLARITEHTRKPVKRIAVFDFIADRDKLQVLDIFTTCLVSGEPMKELFQFEFELGEIGWLQAEATVVRSSGQSRLWNLTLSDHTQERNLDDKLNRLLIARDDFVAAAGHDLRTPIQNISLALQSINKDLLTEPDIKRLAAASTAASDLEVLVDDFMEVSTMSSDREALKTEAFDLQELVSSVCRSFIGASQAKKLRYEQVYHSEVPRFVEGDSLRIKQILYNLLGNAFKYTQSGTVAVTVRLGDVNEFIAGRPQWATRNAVDVTVIEFVVRDTGVGIAAQQIPHIFEPFATAEPFSRKSSGLGLAICDRLVSLMSGRVTVDTEEGNGSTFVVSIPFSANQISDTQDMDSLSATSDLFGDTLAMTQTLNTMSLDEDLVSKYPTKYQQIADSKKLLVVDDNYMVCEMLASLLTLEGWEVMQADSGTEALAILAEHEFRAVITDHKMPYMTGLELGQIIRQSYEGRGWRPVLIIMSGGMPTDSKDAAHDCFDVVLTKPVRAREIHESIRNLSSVTALA